MIKIVELPNKEKYYDPNKPLRPTVIPWKNERIIRTQSVIEAVREMLRTIQTLDVVNVNLIGNPSTGKTTLALTLAHLIHKISPIPFAIRLLNKNDLLNFEKTLESLDPANYVLIFDDVSFLSATASKKQIDNVKQQLTEIRHLKGGQDVKIVNIKNSHYTLAQDKFIRQNDYSFFTSVGSSETDNMEKIIGSKYMGKVHEFRRIFKQATDTKKFTYQLGRKGQFTYNYRNPFIPVLFWNNDSLRLIVSPPRQWIDPVCSICSNYGSKEKFESVIDIHKFKEIADDDLGETIAKRAVRNILKVNGINAENKNVASAERYFSKAMVKENLSLDDLANAYGLTPVNTKLRKNVDAALEASKKDGVTNGDTGIP